MSPHANPGVLPAALAGSALTLAGHLGMLRGYGTVLPYRDPWRCTAIDLVQPWLDGQLGWQNFFTPLNDHWPVLTRALSFLLLRLNGQWNNLLEASVNALILAAAVGLFLAMILPGLRGWTRPAFALLTGAIFALPITWENTLWGIQSLVYLQIALTLVYFAVVCTARTFSLRWWLGQLAGLALLLTQHSAILAQIAVALLLAWRCWRRDGDRRLHFAGLAFAFAAIVAFVAFFPSLGDTAALRADSWELGLEVFLRQLAWPLPHPAFALFVYAPWLFWIFLRLHARRLDPTDAFLLVAGLWVGAQAAAIGYGRGAATYTFVSRYCDFLALGFLLNAACLIRLALAHPSPRLRASLVLFAAAWLLLPLKSFWWESTQSHAGYNLSRRHAENARNLDQLRAYFATHDPGVFPPDDGHGIYPYPPALLPLLDRPAFQALLPPESGAPGARRDHGRLAWLPDLLLPRAGLFTVAGFLLLGWSAFAARARFRWIEEGGARPLGAPELPQGLVRQRSGGPALPVTGCSPVSIPVAPAIAPASFPPRHAAFTLAALCVASSAATLAWQNPFTFDRAARLRALFTPTTAGVTFTDFAFERGDGPVHPIRSTRGAVESRPADARSFWHGTRLPGASDFRGILRSAPLPPHGRYLILPFTGFPCANGNGLRWRFFNPATAEEKWASYEGPNPGAESTLWVVDTAPYAGLQASLVLFDGREDATGWVGVSPVAQTDDPAFATRWSALLHTERTDAAHLTLAALALASGLAFLLSLSLRLRRPPTPPTHLKLVSRNT